MIALTTLVQWLLLGLHATVPWEVGAPGAAASDTLRRTWALAAAPLLLASGLAALWSVDAQVDAALAWGLTWPPRSLPLLCVLFSGAALGVADLLLFAGHRQLEPLGWRIVAAMGWALLVSASVCGELLRIGRGPDPGLLAIGVASLARVLLALAAAETVRGPSGLGAPLAGLALPLSFLAYGPELRAAMGDNLWTLGSATVLLLAARSVPPRLRRPAAFAGLCLAALFLGRSGEISASLEAPSTIPDLLLPEP